MPNAFTSIATTPGLATELVQDAYDLVVGEALREIPTARMFVDRRPGNPAMKGATVTLEKSEWFDQAAVIAATTPLNEELDVDSVKSPKPTPIKVTPEEYGFAVTRTRKLNNRSFAPVDPIIARQVAQHEAETLDYLVQTTFKTGTNVRYANLHAANTGVGAVTATSADTITAKNLLNAKDVRRVVTKLRSAKATPFLGQFFGALVHPDAVLDLREEGGPGTWRTPKEYVDPADIYLGELGEFEGVRFVQNALVHKLANVGSVDVYQNYFFGKGAIVEWVLDEPHVVIGPVVDKLGRFHTVGWLGDLGWTVYENKAVHRILAAASIAEE